MFRLSWGTQKCETWTLHSRKSLSHNKMTISDVRNTTPLFLEIEEPGVRSGLGNPTKLQKHLPSRITKKYQEANSKPVEEELGRIEVSARCRCCVEAQLGTWTWSGTEQSRWWWLSPSQTIFDGPSASLWCQFLVYFCVVPSASSNVDHSVKRFQEILDNWFQDSKLARDTIPSKHLYKPDKSQEARIGLVIILDVPDVEIENKSSLGRCHCWGKLLTGSNRWLPASCPAALVNVAWSPFAISSPAIYTHILTCRRIQTICFKLRQ